MNILLRNLSKLWKVVSIATAVGTLFLFSLFFLLFLYGYSINLSEPNPWIAGLELYLCFSSLLYMIKTNFSSKKYRFILRYPLATLAVTQPLDVVSTWISSIFLDGHEHNPIVSGLGIFNIYFLSMKLLVFPLALLYIQKKYLLPSKALMIVKVMCVVMFAVILNNVVGFI